MFNLRDVLELVIDGFPDCPFAEQKDVVVVQQAALHVGTSEGDELHVVQDSNSCATSLWLM